MESSKVGRREWKGREGMRRIERREEKINKGGRKDRRDGRE